LTDIKETYIPICIAFLFCGARIGAKKSSVAPSPEDVEGVEEEKKTEEINAAKNMEMDDAERGAATGNDSDDIGGAATCKEAETSPPAVAKPPPVEEVHPILKERSDGFSMTGPPGAFFATKEVETLTANTVMALNRGSPLPPLSSQPPLQRNDTLGQPVLELSATTTTTTTMTKPALSKGSGIPSRAAAGNC
jgi:hypothetical protein